MQIKKMPVVSDEWVIEVGDKIFPLLAVKSFALLLLVIVACYMTYNLGFSTSQEYIKIATMLGAGSCNYEMGTCTRYWLVQEGTQVKWQNQTYPIDRNSSLNISQNGIILPGRIG